jgi:DNA polymerase-3 subunit epsilon
MANSLEHLNVLLVDCQATGANPETGSLIELGWARSDTIDEEEDLPKGIETYLVKLPDDQEVPRRVTAITGIHRDDLDSGDAAEEVWRRLIEVATELAESNRMERCPAVIHFSRFEEPFLRDLHRRSGPDGGFPLQIICTHEISRRLFPDLPRRSMRAVAGYLGYSLDEYRRCRGHVEATAYIWRHLVEILRERHDVSSLEDLEDWLDEPPPSVSSRRAYPMADRQRDGLPDGPGVYRMRRSSGDILYVGKATSLRKRVSSYFQKRHHAEHILEMLSQAQKIDITETDSALEAATLESDEIKRLSPPYNVALRERGRKVCFCSDGFREFARAPSRMHPLGPFSSKEPVSRLGELVQVFSMNPRSCDDDLLLRACGLSGAHAMDIGRIRAGSDLFLERHREILREQPIERALVLIGRRLWSERVAGELEDDDEEIQSAKGEEDRGTTPESVSDWIEGIVMRGTREIRRARWLSILMESSLAFEESNTSDVFRLLLLERGRVVDRNTLEHGVSLPVPPGYRRSLIERQESFDLAAVDRMRVVTGEIRRIVTSDLGIRLRLRPEVTLGPERLLRILQWI